MKRCFGCMETYEESSGRCPVCGFDGSRRQTDREALEIGSVLQNRYVVGEEKRRRDTDIIYIGWDTIFNRKVSIQEFFPQYCATRSEGKRLSIYTAETRQELFAKGLSVFTQFGKSLMRLYRESDIAEAYSCFQENGTAYLITAYFDLPGLNDYRKQVRRREARRLIERAADILKRLHREGLIHGNLDETSFWMRGDGSLILRWPEPAKCFCGKLGGLDYGEPGPWTDVYGLAQLSFYVITGKRLPSDFPKDAVLGNRHLKLREKKTISKALKRTNSHGIQSVEAFEDGMFGKRREYQEDIKWRGTGFMPLIGVGIFAGLALTMGGVFFVLKEAEGKESQKVKIESISPVLLKTDLELMVKNCGQIVPERPMDTKADVVQETPEGVQAPDEEIWSGAAVPETKAVAPMPETKAAGAVSSKKEPESSNMKETEAEKPVIEEPQLETKAAVLGPQETVPETEAEEIAAEEVATEETISTLQEEEKEEKSEKIPPLEVSGEIQETPDAMKEVKGLIENASPSNPGPGETGAP